jgi:hypothetical protein
VASTICPPIARYPAARSTASKTREQAFDRAGLGQLLAEQPDRLGIGHPVLEGKVQEPHE